MKRLITLFLLIPFISSAQDSMNVRLLFNWNDTTITGTFAFNNRYNDVWGYEKNGEEYAIMGSTRGTHIFDITVPANSYEAAFVFGADTGANIIHRDYHDYAGYLYVVCDEGPSTLQIIDMQYLPDSVVVVYDSDDLLSRAHNIFIDSATAKLYVLSQKNSFGNDALVIYSLADPVDPQLLYTYNDVGHVHDAFIKNDTAFLNCGSQGLRIVDFTGALHNTVGSLTVYPDLGYNHSGWLSPDGNTYVFADEGHGLKMKVCDVTDFTNINVLSLIGSGWDPNSIPHNEIIDGDYLFVSYYYDGLQIWNIKDPNYPVRVGFYDTFGKSNQASYEGAWGIYPFLPSGVLLLSDMQTGLHVFDVVDALTQPVAFFTYETTDSVTFTFTDRSVNDPTQWLWNFSDGDTSSTANPMHTYNSAGSYNVCLTVTNSFGMNTYCEEIVAQEYPTALFSYTIDTVNTLKVYFDDQSTAATSWMWDFGDGDQSNLTMPTHEYDTAGTYNVCLVASNIVGADTSCQNLMVVGDTSDTSGTGLTSLVDNGITIYPQPFDQMIVVESNDEPILALVLYDLNGRLIMTRTDRSTEHKVVLDELADLNSGVYLIKVFTLKQVHAGKLIKLR
ncbi:MAG: choice-of-anchor B family protein [Bacteroidetes bacterium]|nr:choice-of-anchor B family protein [Bacteroidota bacterium]